MSFVLDTAASRSASIGSVRAARRAGIITDTSVITVPSTMPWTTTCGLTTIPLPGSDTPTADRIAMRPNASAKPAATPSAEPIRPITRPSKRSERFNCFGVAPIAASTASSRRRWATMTLNVL